MTASAEPSAATQAMLLRAYLAYNAQDADRLLSLVSTDVDWPDGSGGRIHGRQALAAYWAEQWQRVRAHDHPVEFRELDDGRVAVEVEQVVRSLDGTTVSTDRFVHLHRLDRDGTHIARMDIAVDADVSCCQRVPGLVRRRRRRARGHGRRTGAHGGSAVRPGAVAVLTLEGPAERERAGVAHRVGDRSHRGVLVQQQVRGEREPEARRLSSSP